MTIYETDLIDRSRAWVAAAAGELSQACEILAAAAGRARAAKLRIAEARLLHDLARLGQPGPAAPRSAAQRLAELAAEVDGQLVAAMAEHAAALARGPGANLAAAGQAEAAGDAFQSLGASLLAAEAYLAAAGRYRAEGRTRQTSAMARQASELAASCGDVRTPGLSQGAGTVTDRLTRREREVAGLAAAGASSREIAARLVLSVRTVDNHLQNAYSKLGVTSRDELAQILRTGPKQQADPITPAAAAAWVSGSSA